MASPATAGAELRYLRIARDRADLLEARITDLNELLRMETGEWRMQRDPRQLTAVLGGLAADYREDALLLGRRFQTDIDLPDSLVVDADWGLFTRVTDNLMENALHYTGSGDCIRFAALQRNGHVQISVQDSGPAFPPTSWNTFSIRSSAAMRRGASPAAAWGCPWRAPLYRRTAGTSVPPTPPTAMATARALRS